MPYKVYKIRNSRFYRVKNTETGEIKAKRTTLTRARNQVKLLNGIEHGMMPRGRK